MDLGAPPGTEIHAAFDAHITKLSPHDPATDSGKVYGAQLFMRASNDMMGGFYTHLADVPANLAVGSTVSRGDVLGTVLASGGIPPHVHMALVEIIGGAPGGRYQGVDLYQLFLDISNSDTVTSVSFMQDGSPPVPGGGSGGGGSSGGAKVYHLGSLRGIQEGLAVLGFDPGGIDGLDGPKTRAAVTQFQASQGLSQDGQAGPNTRAALANALIEQGHQVDGV
jgi:hypothetical protein